MTADVETRSAEGSHPTMSVFEAIRTRRSVGKMRPERPPRELVERLLEAALCAPNHHLTEPWRFVVIAGPARNELGEALARARRRLNPDAPPAALERERAKPLRAPVVIAMAVEPAAGPKVVEVEEIAAGAAAVQNLLLAAHALGLAAMWRTGDTCYCPEINEYLGLSPAARLLGLIYVGYPAIPLPAPRERPSAAFTRWLGWDESGTG